MTPNRSPRWGWGWMLPVLVSAVLLTWSAMERQPAVAATQPPFVNGILRDLVPEALEYVDNRVLAAGVAETLTVPSNAQEPGTATQGPRMMAYWSCEGTFWLRVGGTAAVPVADISTGVGSLRNPSRMVFYQGQTYSMISAANNTCSIGYGLVRN